MNNLNEILNDFLSDQDKRLSKRTYNDYRKVIELFENYLNSYAYLHLSGKEREIFEKRSINGEESYCELYTIDKIGSLEIDDFLTDFLIRKVMAAKGLIKITITVLRRFSKWLKNNYYIEAEKFEEIYSAINKRKDDLPGVVELSDLIYKESLKNQSNEYDSYEQGNYNITRIKAGRLWVRNYMEGETEFGPVIVPKKISDLAEEECFVYLKLGQKNDKYYIVDSGNVYPV